MKQTSKNIVGLLSSVAMVASVACGAHANRGEPVLPSIEIHLEVLTSLRQTVANRQLAQQAPRVNPIQSGNRQVVAQRIEPTLVDRTSVQKTQPVVESVVIMQKLPGMDRQELPNTGEEIVMQPMPRIASAQPTEVSEAPSADVVENIAKPAISSPMKVDFEPAYGEIVSAQTPSKIIAPIEEGNSNVAAARLASELETSAKAPRQEVTKDESLLSSVENFFLGSDKKSEPEVSIQKPTTPAQIPVVSAQKINAATNSKELAQNPLAPPSISQKKLVVPKQVVLPIPEGFPIASRLAEDEALAERFVEPESIKVSPQKISIKKPVISSAPPLIQQPVADVVSSKVSLPSVVATNKPVISAPQIPVSNVAEPKKPTLIVEPPKVANIELPSSPAIKNSEETLKWLEEDTGDSKVAEALNPLLVAKDVPAKVVNNTKQNSEKLTVEAAKTANNAAEIAVKKPSVKVVKKPEVNEEFQLKPIETPKNLTQAEATFLNSAEKKDTLSTEEFDLVENEVKELGDFTIEPFKAPAVESKVAVDKKKEAEKKIKQVKEITKAEIETPKLEAKASKIVENKTAALSDNDLNDLFGENISRNADLVKPKVANLEPEKAIKKLDSEVVKKVEPIDKKIIELEKTTEISELEVIPPKVNMVSKKPVAVDKKDESWFPGVKNTFKSLLGNDEKKVTSKEPSSVSKASKLDNLTSMPAELPVVDSDITELAVADTKSSLPSMKLLKGAGDSSVAKSSGLPSMALLNDNKTESVQELDLLSMPEIPDVIDNTATKSVSALALKTKDEPIQVEKTNSLPKNTKEVKVKKAEIDKEESFELASLEPVVKKTSVSPSADVVIDYSKDETDIPNAIKQKLDSLSNKAKEADSRIIISAYASGTEDEKKAANMISLSRALSLRAYFIDQEIEMDRIIVQAKGIENKGGSADRADITLD